MSMDGIIASEFLTSENSARIFNLDESGFPLAGTNGKLRVLTDRGAKNVYRVSPDTREQITVLGCASANGELQKPFVLYPGQRPTFNFEGLDPDDFDVGVSPNGWISSDTFFAWLSNLFYKRIRDTLQFPVNVFMDGHSSHINQAVSDFCIEKNIILYCFPPHASHLIQPLDVSVYGPLKKYWNESLEDFSRSYKSLYMSRMHFLQVFDKTWKRACESTDNIKSGFRKCGLVPYNPDAVAYDRILMTPTAAIAETGQIRMTDKEVIGIKVTLQKFEAFLSEDELAMFQNRLENNYDIVDNTLENRMFRFYKESKLITRSRLTEPSNSTVITCSTSVESSEPDVESNEPEPAADPPLVAAAVTSFESLINQPSTSAGAISVRSYDNWTVSPFKDHLKISDNVVQTKKVTVRKPKFPSAISGREYNSYITKQQDLKRKALEDKENRKKIRMEKAKEKEAKKIMKSKKRENISEEGSATEEEQEVVYDDDSDADFNDSTDSEANEILEQMEMEADACAKCKSKSGWSNNRSWIGCGCGRWFHRRTCTTETVATMPFADIKSFDFVCEFCKVQENNS